MSLPITTKAWTVQGNAGFDSLVFTAQSAIPQLSAYDVLVKFHAVSLNYRDISIPKVYTLHPNIYVRPIDTYRAHSPSAIKKVSYQDQMAREKSSLSVPRSPAFSEDRRSLRSSIKRTNMAL